MKYVSGLSCACVLFKSLSYILFNDLNGLDFPLNSIHYFYIVLEYKGNCMPVYVQLIHMVNII